MKRGIFELFLLAYIAGLWGCAADRPLEKTAFIDHYQTLTTSKRNHKLRYYERSGVVWTHYKKVLLEPVQIRFREHADLLKIKPNELQMLSDYFAKQISWSLGKKYAIVQRSAPDVLRVRVALTDAVPIDPSLNVVSLFMAAMSTDIGAASIEAEVLDSESLTRLFAIAERKEGFALNYARGFARWSHVKGAMRDWASDFRDALDRITKR